MVFVLKRMCYKTAAEGIHINLILKLKQFVWPCTLLYSRDLSTYDSFAEQELNIADILSTIK